MNFSQPVMPLMRKRFSCRNYENRPLSESERHSLAEFLANLPPGPFGGRPRFMLAAATQEDRSALRGLGTYGFIRGAPAFMFGAATQAAGNMEDYGYLMEAAVLRAADLGLGTCWLGGTFSHSSFAAKIGLKPAEILPAVVPTGAISARRYPPADLIRRTARSDSRLGWSDLFFNGDTSAPLTPEQAGGYADALEMVRLGPSASNKQPWRVVKRGGTWHFLLKRTSGYGAGLTSMFIHADLQRIDMGIALCHFALSAAELGLRGSWQNMPDQAVGSATEYILSWVESSPT